MLSKDKIRQSIKSVLQIKRLLAILLCSALVFTGSIILGDTTKLIKITDGERNYFVRSITGNVRTALGMVNLRSANYKILSSETNANTTSINIEYLFPVFVTVGDLTKEVYTGKSTVGEILKSAGYVVDEFDLVYPALDTEISETAYIDYTNIDYVSGNYTETVACNTVTVHNPSLAVGTEKFEAGKEGLQQVNYTDKYVNGVKTETNIDNTVVLAQSVDNKKIVGTKPNVAPAVKTNNDVKCVSTLTPSEPIELDANGVPVNYSKKISARATAYTYTGNRCSTGVAPQPGYIAVNPKYIPYGTKMYIKTVDGSYIYGYAVAADTGGFIKKHPTGVDLFFTSESACQTFGVRTVEIYILN